MTAVTKELATKADVILVGASTRAAAFSALRAGFQPICLDLYGDTDACSHVQVQRVSDYPDGLLDALKSLPSLPVVYTGGLENRPDLLELIERDHEIWGNSSAAVQRARAPEVLEEAARMARTAVPEWRGEGEPPPTDGTWLLRPRHGCGGVGITLWTDDQRDSATLEQPHLFQKRVQGVPYSAVFIASAEPGDVRFVGMTRQLIGERECNARDFQWCGNVGPVVLPVGIENLIRRLGNILKWKVGLLGLYGFDFILDESGVPWVTEINPRYPASVELLEHATGQPLFLDHCRCFTTETLPSSGWNRAHPGEFMGKAVFYSPGEFTLECPLFDPGEVSWLEFPEMTDLPPVGTRFQRGDPICTLFAESFSADETWQLLRKESLALSARLKI